MLETEGVLRLEPEQLQYLTDDEKSRYMRLENMFASDGWPLLTALCKRLASEAFARSANSTSWEQHCLNKGLRLAYEHIATIEQSTHNEFIEMADSVRQKALEADLADEFENQT